MKLRSIDLLWPYGPESGRAASQMEVIVDLEDDTRWMSSFFDTHRYNQGVKGFKGLGPDQPFRHGPRLVIVRGPRTNWALASVSAAWTSSSTYAG